MMVHPRVHLGLSLGGHMASKTRLFKDKCLYSAVW